MIRVTHAIQLAGLIDSSWFTPEATARGTAVHEATALDDAGDLDEASVHEAVRPYLESWRKFRQECGLSCLAIELPVRHVPFDFETKGIDRIMGREMIAGSFRPIIIDLKTCAAPSAWHPIQTAAYHMAYTWQAKEPGIVERGMVYLQADGSAGKLVMHKDRRDLEVWKAVLTVAKFKEAHS